MVKQEQCGKQTECILNSMYSKIRTPMYVYARWVVVSEAQVDTIAYISGNEWNRDDTTATTK